MRIFFIVAKWIYMDDVNVYVLFRCYCAVAQYKHTQYLAIRMFESKCVYVCVCMRALAIVLVNRTICSHTKTHFTKAKRKKNIFAYYITAIATCVHVHKDIITKKKYSELKRLILCFILIWLNNNTSKREWQQLKAIR